MSRQRIVDGVDDRGRPRTRWADPDAADGPAYGHMEPAHVATIERRRLSAEELDERTRAEAAHAARTRQTPIHLQNTAEVRASRARGRQTNAEHLAASRARGAQRHVQVIAERRAVTPAAEEEPAMTDESETPAPDVDDAPPRVALEEALELLASRATAAAGAWSDKVAADQAWEAASAALDAAWALVGRGQQLDAAGIRLQVLGDLVEAADRAIAVGIDGEEPELASAVAAVEEALELEAPGTLERVEPVAPTASNGAEPVDELTRLTTHQRKVIEATIRLQGDRKAVAEELHVMREGVDVVLESIGKKGLLPAFIIPLLPARFAKYSTVASS
jgi:hypothetical protein